MMARNTRAVLAVGASAAVLTISVGTVYAEEVDPLLTAPTEATVVKLQVAHSGKCLDIDHGKADNGVQAQQWTCNGSNAQQWRVTPAVNSTFELRSVVSGKCLEVKDGSTQAGAVAQQWTCSEAEHMRWQMVLVDQERKLFQLRPAHITNRCLDVAGAKTENGVKAQQWYCNQSDPQLWQIQPVT